jgi:hypothetical protein
MLKIPISEPAYQEAEKRLAEMPVLAGSHRGEAANEVGVLGEVVTEWCLSALHVPFKREGKTSHDLRIIDKGVVEIKTKDRTVRPLPHYDCSVPLYNHDHQAVDWYIFVSLFRGKKQGLRRFTEAWIVGCMGRDRLQSIGQVWKAGETDPSNGTKFWTDCINVAIKDLKPFLSAAEIWKSGSVDGTRP